MLKYFRINTSFKLWLLKRKVKWFKLFSKKIYNLCRCQNTFDNILIVFETKNDILKSMISEERCYINHINETSVNFVYIKLLDICYIQKKYLV